MAIGQHQDGRLKRHDARDATQAVDAGTVGEIGNFTLTQYLYAVRVDVVEVADQISTRAGGAHRDFIKTAL